ncbi:hypothetical protein ACIBCB_18175 [Streptomyces uncialis]|uniref:hypothetical protein n=1 Tax=Streptomyces uncialis TaxID=1048205 RepID=UPI0037BD17D2
MKPTPQAINNGWSWVLGLSGEECRVRRHPDFDPAQILAQVAQLLGVDDPARVPTVVRQLQQDRKRALESAVKAWSAVHHLLQEGKGETA